MGRLWEPGAGFRSERHHPASVEIVDRQLEEGRHDVEEGRHDERSHSFGQRALREPGRARGVLGASAAELCRRIEVPVSRITKILVVRRAVTGGTALRSGRVFGTSGEFWLNL